VVVLLGDPHFLNIEKNMADRQLSVVFPGQGSQSVGMLSGLSSKFSEVRLTFDEASEVLNYDLWDLVKHGPDSELNKTVHTQPALLAASYAIWKIITTCSTSQGAFAPALLAGHSLGEYTALVCANALSYQDAIKLVAARGEYMQEAVLNGEGGMAAIVGLDESSVSAICEDAKSNENEVLSPANFNSIGQIVIAGHMTAVKKAVLLAKERGAKLAVLLPVSVPSHCQLMKPAAERLSALLETIPIQNPVIPVISNVNVTCYDNAQSIRDGLTQQLYMPVRWVETILYFVKNGTTDIFECGPGKVLTGLNKRIDKNLHCYNTSDSPFLLMD
jgi:[acyl-carrier-protein] S-malonyltransferase